MLNIAVVGLGKMGEYHVQKYQSFPSIRVYGMDIDIKRIRDMSQKYNFFGMSAVYNFIDIVDAVSICTPPDTHYDIAKEFLLKGKHVLLEKPMTGDYKLYSELLEIAKSQDCILMPGLTELHNPAIMSLVSLVQNPLNTISSRIVPYDTRVAGTDVVLDLMIHDLAILSELYDKDPKIWATGNYNKVHAWLTFPEGQTAYLVASRTLSKSHERSILALTRNREYLVDCQKQTLTYKQDELTNTIPYAVIDSLSLEIMAFLSSIKIGIKPMTTGLQALKYANQIKDMI